MFDNAKQDLQRSKGPLSFGSFRPSCLTSESKLRKIIPSTLCGLSPNLSRFALIAPLLRFSYLSALSTLLSTLAPSMRHDRFR